MHHNWLLQFCNPTRPDSLIGSMGFGPMGFGVAGVMGAKLAAPDRPCVSVCGDGAFFMHANALGTAVAYNLPVVWVVWNNYAYGSIRGLQRGYLDSRELATDFHHPETGQPYNPDFAAMARSAGRARHGALAPPRTRDVSTPIAGDAACAAHGHRRHCAPDALRKRAAAAWPLPTLGRR